MRRTNSGRPSDCSKCTRNSGIQPVVRCRIRTAREFTEYNAPTHCSYYERRWK